MLHSPPHKAGFVNILGKPNVGKSTLMNALVGEKLSIITAKAQTTRHRIAGILSGEHFQIVYTDTPGAITPSYELQQSMMRAMNSALLDADIVLWVVDVHDREAQTALGQRLQQLACPVFLVLNKMDTISSAELGEVLQYWSGQVNVQAFLPISALERKNVDALFERILAALPEHPAYYPKEMITDKPERFFVAEIIREKILQHYHQEIPYSTEVVIDSFKEDEKLIRISATIHVERRSQRGILIGKQGSGLKRIGTEARQGLEQFFDKKVFLEQYVRVAPDWRKKGVFLQKFGYE